ncbi:MAG: DUF2063 domain-containing protein [Gallionellaceae bacterium]|nr:MAG: DUF2063 domain-containing protein [Gallionellaceae bacterium]
MADLNDDLSGFARAIVHGETPAAQIKDSYPNYSADIAIEVYRNNYRGNLHDALAGAYPVIKQLVGDDFFRFMARKFVEQHPSHSANLHHYGAELADFVAGFAPAQELVYLPDVAALEWACHVAYFAADAGKLSLERLAQVPPEQYPYLILRAHPSCGIVRSRYPVSAIWHAHQPGADSDFHIDLASGPAIALVSRIGDVVQVDDVSEAEADWIQRIQSGEMLGMATVATLGRHPDFDLQATLLKLATQNVLIAFTHGAEP